MNFLNFEYFLVIVEEGGFSRAARRLYVSQQALSEHVKKLEEEIGVPLLKRDGKLRLTVAGECFAEGAREIFRVKDKMLRDIANVTDKRRRKITLGIPPYDIPPFLPDLLTEYKKSYPQYDYAVIERDDVDISHNFNGIDLYICYMPIDPNTERIFITEDDYCALVISDELIQKTYGKRWKTIEKALMKKHDLSLLKDVPFIMPLKKYGYQSRYITNIFNEYSFSPTVSFESDSGELNASMCIRGEGAYLGHRDYCERKFSKYIDPENGPLKLYRIKTFEAKSDLVICYQKGKHLHPAETSFIETAKKQVNGQNS